MSSVNPFSQENLNNIFKVSAKYPDRLNSRESSWLEFKEKFSFGSLSKYAKTMAAFANTQGGYIVFGVKNQPHRMVGIEGEPKVIYPRKEKISILDFIFQEAASSIVRIIERMVHDKLKGI